METLDIPCPACGRSPVLYRMGQTDVPYFGPLVETLLLCSQCGFRHTDTILTQQRDPVRVRLLVDREEDMSVRVVRSASCTIRVPEFGVEVEPGPRAESFVSNVEGVLVRVERIVRYLVQDADDAGARDRAKALLDRLDGLRRGEGRATLVLEDPFGNSAILSDRAVTEALTREEAAKLKTGLTIMDLGGTVTEDGEKKPPEGDPRGG